MHSGGNFFAVEAPLKFSQFLQLLHIIDKAHKTRLLVTDYTKHPGFLYPCDQDWSQGLEGRVLAIQLRDNQIQNAKSLKKNGGKFVTIKNLRLSPDGASKKLQGDLGGYDLLLNLLQPDSPNEDLQALHQYVSGFSIPLNPCSLLQGVKRSFSTRKKERKTKTKRNYNHIVSLVNPKLYRLLSDQI